MKVIVFGSINMDLVVTTPQLPQPGETLNGHAFFTTPGGKGANQAVAAARLGAETVMIGRVGNDSFSEPLLTNLANNGVNTGSVQMDSDTSSGVALISVDDAAENTIVIVAGANGRIDQTDVERLAALIEPNDILLLQLEVPMTAVLAAAQVATQKQATIILDPAPAQPLPDELLAQADIITPNESEALVLTGISVSDRASAELAAQQLHQRGARQVLIKMGSAGALWSTKDGVSLVTPFKVEAIDTVAAGDACNGGMAAGLCNGRSITDALRWGMAAGALATTSHGAQEAMPSQTELFELLDG